MRVEIPTKTARWKRGDRYGEVVSCRYVKSRDGLSEGRDVYRVKLDKSGDVKTFAAYECKVVDG